MVVVDRLLSPFRAPQFKWIQVFLLTGFAVTVWCAVGLGPYSGMAAPVMYGDFEAQRHWMEITQHLPFSQWYFYDLEWWGLDYPPLTAYHSWLCGKIGSVLYTPEWFELDFSRGIETPDLKAFMRNSAIVSHLCTLLPAIILISRLPNYCRKRLAGLTALLLQPSLVIIDHGHFQFNAVMLGFFALSFWNLEKRRLVVASFWFVLSLFFKQMALYYAPVIFFTLLSRCYFPRINLGRLVAIGSTVIVVSVALLVPFYNHLDQVAFRVFPFARGLWEDKVANLWCALNTVIKLKQLVPQEKLQKLALATTLLGITPSCIAAFLRKGQLSSQFASCAWAFYLFSFQVHEKSVLLPLLPTTLTLLANNFTNDAMIYWINNIAYFSMWPLLKREGLGLQYVCVFLLWNWLLSVWKSWPSNGLNRLIVAGSYAAVATVTVAELSGIIPYHVLLRLPDLWSVLNLTICFACFSYFYLWQTVSLFIA